jgi:hypothetical protein
LPDAPVSLQVLENGGHFQLSVPPRRYRSGVASLRADLPPGNYTVFVSVEESEESRRIAFPLAVGAWWHTVVGPIIVVLVISAGTLGYCIFQLGRIASERRDPAINNCVELRSVGKGS